MPTDVEVTDPKISIFVPVAPATVDGVGEICHNATLIGRLGTHYSRCWNCRSLAAGSVRTIVPISLVHTSESQLYASLRDYKSERPYISERVRAQHVLLLAATLQRFLRIHRLHIEQAAGVASDAIQVVPSTRKRHGDHPTTGARVQSAAMALANAGATVVAAVPVGRVIDTDHPTKEAFWRERRSHTFSFDTCCLEG